MSRFQLFRGPVEGGSNSFSLFVLLHHHFIVMLNGIVFDVPNSRQTEITNFDLVIFEEDVSRFEISVDDSP